MIARWMASRWLLVPLVAITAIPLLWPAIPPLEDLPGHIGRYRVMLGGDAALASYYSFHWHLVGNLGVDLAVRATAPIFGLEPSVKAIVIAIVMLTVLGIVTLSREIHGRVTAGAILAIPLSYNFAFQFGFVNFTLAAALALNGFALWLHLAHRPRLRATLFVPLSMIIWIAHIAGWGILGLLAWGGEWQMRRDRGESPVRAMGDAALACTALALPMLAILFWREAESGGITTRFFDLPAKALWIASILRDRWMVLDIASCAILLGFVYRAWRDPLTRFAPVIGIGALLLLIAFVAMPFGVFGSAFADMRLAPYMLIAALLSIDDSRARPRTRNRLLLGATIFWVARIATTTISFANYAQANERHLAALSHIEPGSRVVALVGVKGCDRPWALGRINHLPSLAIARRDAFSNDQWRMEGAPLLQIRAGAPSGFAADPSQTVLPDRCGTIGDIRTIDQALTSLPTGSIDYLWLIDPPTYTRANVAGFRPIWEDGSDILYRIETKGARRER